MRNFFLACSRSGWLRERAPRYRFVRKSVSRFMPGESPAEALDAASALSSKAIGTVFTYLGENIVERSESERVTFHYLGLLDQIRARGLDTELSVKLTRTWASVCKLTFTAPPLILNR
jgi:proline dehydrogenase